MYFQFLWTFFKWVIWFFYYCLCSLYIWGISSLSDIWFSSIFFLFVNCTSFSMIRTLKHKCFEFYPFFLCCYAFDVKSKKPLPYGVTKIYSCFHLEFIVLIFTFRLFIHFEVIFVYGVEIKFPLHVDIQFSQDDLLKVLSLLSCLDS